MKFAQFRMERTQARQCIIATAFLFVISASASAEPKGPETVDSPSADEQEALNTVSQRTTGYNSHDIVAFLAAHSEEVQIYEFPDRKIGVGRAHLKRIFGPQFERGKDHVEVLRQIAIGNRVVSYENISIDQEIERLAAVYTVEHGEITSLRLIESND